MSRRILIVACALLVASALAVKPQHFGAFKDIEHLVDPNMAPTDEDHGFVKEVKQLPGWPSDTPFPSRLFTGFADLKKAATPNTTMMMHYLVFLSENNHTSDPVLVWFNGGPGATSAWGLFVENGPFQLNEASLIGEEYERTGIPQLILNPYRWTKFASLLVLAAPPPIGFSYCTPPGPPGNGTACGTWNDTRCGVADAEALGIIFNKHMPWLLFGSPDTKLFFMGESYAGVFISETLVQMWENSYFSNITNKIAGVALGDACLGGDVLCGGANGIYSYLLFMYGHGQFPTELWEELMDKCTMEELTHRGTLSAQCQAVVNECNDAVGGYYTYNLYDQCQDNMFAPWHKARVHRHPQLPKPTPRRPNAPRDVTSAPSPGGLWPTPFKNLDGYWCPGHVFQHYFNHTSVREAFHVPVDSFFFNEDDAVGMKYIFNERDVMPLYRTLLALRQGNTTMAPLHIMSYNGDADPAVNMFDSENVWYNFARNYSMNKTEKWRPWTYGDGTNTVAGSVTEWRKNVGTTENPVEAGKLWYVTIRGSGHMVPEYRPISAQTLAEAFVRGHDLPKYMKPGK